MLFINRVILTWKILLLQTVIIILKNKGNAQKSNLAKTIYDIKVFTLRKNRLMITGNPDTLT